MLLKVLLLSVVIACGTSFANAQSDPPKLDPTPSTGQQTFLIQEGIAQHDRGNYDAAIKLYEEVLAENPNNVDALYELSSTLSQKNDFRRSLEIAYRGAKYKSEILVAFYLQIGNNLDLLGQPEKSVEAYKAGIKLLPRMPMLPFNLAVTYRGMGKLDDAREAVKRAIALNPDHAGSHFFLSALWKEGGYRMPALLAACRFLVLEGRSERAPAMLLTVKDSMAGTVTAGGANPNQINIFLNTNTKKDEGDFGTIELALGLTRAASMTEKNKGKTQIQLLVGQFETLFAIMSEQSDKEIRGKFAGKYYVPYFNEMKQKNFVEPFVYYITQSDGNEETLKWLAANKARVGDFLTWSKFYTWPGAD
ncbi:MAG TPA: tetratricopeptide repeat protein [Pyrinomonadaceae bacterium]|nr:tetratricopeptide repeat protein [Pyrinomonadaceae bacterium]